MHNTTTTQSLAKAESAPFTKAEFRRIAKAELAKLDASIADLKRGIALLEVRFGIRK
jgi:hypothetical protein